MGAAASLTTDLYQLTMAAAYLQAGKAGETATFELFVRAPAARRSYLLAAGLAQAADYLEGLRFGAEEIAYLRGLEALRPAGEGFFEWLAGFRFRGDVDAMPEGTVAYADEPLLRVRGRLPDAQILESYLLATLGFQTLVATKASRVVGASAGRPVVEFGLRRAHGPEAGLLAARACYLAGCAGTSHVEAGRRFSIPVFGTCAHSFILSFDREEEAFQAWCDAWSRDSVLLLDTYETVGAARRAAAVRPAPSGVRLDSGDLAALSRQ
ncbi:MAG: nicotinate phosphoribosyltransferase, partial [Planctomycetota bacterium]